MRLMDLDSQANGACFPLSEVLSGRKNHPTKSGNRGSAASIILVSLLLFAAACRAQQNDAVVDSTTDSTSHAVAAPDKPATDAADSEAGKQGLLKIAKRSQNPVSSIYKFQIQSFFNPNMGKNDVAQYSESLILTVPFHLDKHWDLITRTSVPVSYLPAANPGTYDAYGTGDLNPTAYLTPRHFALHPWGSFSWGVGPSFQFDTAMDHNLGSGQNSAGPAAVGVLTTRRWVIGSRINNMWSFSGTKGRKDFNVMWAQPFIYYNFKPGWYIDSDPTITANWKASNGNILTLPFGSGIGHLMHLGEGWTMMMNADAFAFGTAPSGSGNWQAMAQIQLIHRAK